MITGVRRKGGGGGGGGGGGEEKNEHFLKSIYQAYFLIRAEVPRIIDHFL